MQQLLLSLVTLETPNDTETAAVGILLPTTTKFDWKCKEQNPDKTAGNWFIKAIFHKAINSWDDIIPQQM